MKKSFSPHLVACLTLGLIAQISAQNLAGHLVLSEPFFRPDRPQHRFPVNLPGTYELPAVQRAEGTLRLEPSVFAAQDSSTLTHKEDTSCRVDSVVDLDLLRNPSPYRKILVSTHGQPYEITEDSLQTGLARISATYRESGKPEISADCSPITLSIEQQLRLNPSQVLEIVEREIAANPACSCEVVKTAIKTIDANADEVVAIVQAGIHASPESMRIISQCAIAANPGSICGVQALLAKLDPNAGRAARSAKSAKSAKTAVIVDPLPNPLDRPPPFFIPPPPIFPRPVTEVDPNGPLSSWF